MRLLAPAVAVAIAGAATATVAVPPSRPLLYGSGYIYPAWKGFTGAAANAWEEAALSALVDMGAAATGASFNWCDIEPEEGAPYNWTETDATVASAAEKGLAMLAYMGNTPDWALGPSHKGLGYRFPPLEQYTSNFQTWVAAVAERYAGNVTMYEFWNEQNGCGWEADGCANSKSAPTYAPWLCTWAATMRQADPRARLSVGGLDYNSEVTDGYQYIEDLYTAGAGDCFDAVALHPYDDGSPGHEIHYEALRDTYNVLVRHNHSHKRLWMNEYGWKSSDETMKAAAMTAVLTALRDNYTYVETSMYLSLTDLPGVPDSGHGYGLASQDTEHQTVTPRASYDAFKAFVSATSRESRKHIGGNTRSTAAAP